LRALAAIVMTLAGCAADGAVDAAKQMQVASDPAAMMRIAGAAERAGDPASAAAFYQRAVDLQPGSDAAVIGVARSMAEQGSTEEAIDLLRGTHIRLPGDTLVAATLGRLLVVAHRPSEALTAFGEGLQTDPRSASLLIGEGVALDAIGQHPAAQENYRAALAVAPDSVAAQNNLALSLAMTGQAEQAAAILRRLHSAADPADRATVDGNLALAYGLQGDVANAAATARQTMPEADVNANLTAYATLRGHGTGDATGADARGVDGAMAAPTAGTTPGAAPPSAGSDCVETPGSPLSRCTSRAFKPSS